MAFPGPRQVSDECFGKVHFSNECFEGDECSGRDTFTCARLLLVSPSGLLQGRRRGRTIRHVAIGAAVPGPAPGTARELGAAVPGPAPGTGRHKRARTIRHVAMGAAGDSGGTTMGAAGMRGWARSQSCSLSLMKLPPGAYPTRQCPSKSRRLVSAWPPAGLRLNRKSKFYVDVGHSPVGLSNSSLGSLTKSRVLGVCDITWDRVFVVGPPPFLSLHAPIRRDAAHQRSLRNLANAPNIHQVLTSRAR